jgi:hypothetical protein
VEHGEAMCLDRMHQVETSVCHPSRSLTHLSVKIPDPVVVTFLDLPLRHYRQCCSPAFSLSAPWSLAGIARAQRASGRELGIPARSLSQNALLNATSVLAAGTQQSVLQNPWALYCNAGGPAIGAEVE